MGYESVISYLSSMEDIAVIIRLIMAAFFGCIVGWERVITKHSAGIRTFTLVSLGSAVATALNLYMAVLPGVGADVSRIPAGVVSGIGFLGAGTILVTGRQQIKGLTTAASLWVTACMGMAIGAGYIEIGTVCFLLIMIANVILMRLSQSVEDNSKYISIYIEVNKSGGIKKLSKWLSEQDYMISSMTKSREKPLQSSDAALLVDVDFGRKHPHSSFLTELNELEFVSYVEEV